jgi:hypothetical protein
VPLMLMLVKFCLKTQDWFEHEPASAPSGSEPAGVEPS